MLIVRHIFDIFSHARNRHRDIFSHIRRQESQLLYSSVLSCILNWFSPFRLSIIQKPAPAGPGEFKAEAVVAGATMTKQIALSDYKGKYVVLFFYPLDWTFVCPTEHLES